MHIIVGLGNPGTEYENTRHNAGFMVIDRLAKKYGIKLDRKSRLMRWGRGSISHKDVILMKPMTYMNESGLAVRRILSEQGANPRNLIVVYDDLDLEPGRIRIRENGGSGGHKGIRSIIGQLGDEGFTRVRVGIGRPPGRQDPADYVLSPFTKRQWEEVDVAISKAVDAIVYIIEHGAEKAMNEFNRRDEADV